MVGLREYGGNEALAQSIIEGVVHVLHADAETACCVPVDVQVEHGSGRHVIACYGLYVFVSGQGLPEFFLPGIEFGLGDRFHGDLVHGAGGAILDGEILNGIEIEPHARNFGCGAVHEPAAEIRGAFAAF